MIPDVDRNQILAALGKFDELERLTQQWANWESKGPYKFAVLHDGRRYPVKRIVALATGVPESGFSGGEEANSYLRKRGFEVIGIREDETRLGMKALLSQVLELQKSYSVQLTTNMQERRELVERKSLALLQEWIASNPALSVEGSSGKGNQARIPWIRVFSKARSPSATAGFYFVYLFAADGSSVAISLNQGTNTYANGSFRPKPREDLESNLHKARGVVGHDAQQAGLGIQIDLRDPAGKGKNYEQGNVFAKTYPTGHIPDEAALREDFDLFVRLLEKIYEEVEDSVQPDVKEHAVSRTSPAGLVEHIARSVEESGFVYEPWQIATFVTALRTKPFLILAGISGTGKTKLPILAAISTGSEYQVTPVRPDWNDSGDLLGYTDLAGEFRAKSFLQQCFAASEASERQHFAVIDEMNIARVEHYFAEVLSRLEDRSLTEEMSQPLVLSGGKGFEPYKEVGVPRNLAIVGTVNMDESTHGFSKKVLDRAFTLELSDVDLTRIMTRSATPNTVAFESSAWRPQFSTLGDALGNEEWAMLIGQGIADLQKLNTVLAKAQMQLGYRSRDEILLFVIEAQTSLEFFVDSQGIRVDPLDLALMMKVLPRIAGSSHAVERVIDGLLEIAHPGVSASEALAGWQDSEMPQALPGARWPRTAARLCLMKQRLEDGYTSFFL